MSALLEMDRHDGIIAVTPENVAELVNEVRRLREAGQMLLGEMWEHDIADDYTVSGAAYRAASAVFNPTTAATK